MGKMLFVITDELEYEIRKKALNEYVGEKGALSKAATEAFSAWINKKKA